ncbi:hypothetical protein [Actinomadura sp. 9N215]|uniref:hypothetical protein n=1 Tax=Actinomadura sp. 9N215 TaxID=3375150 RepID=UPI0037A187AE
MNNRTRGNGRLAWERAARLMPFMITLCLAMFSASLIAYYAFDRAYPGIALSSGLGSVTGLLWAINNRKGTTR